MALLSERDLYFLRVCNQQFSAGFVAAAFGKHGYLSTPTSLDRFMAL
jgi:hypothetical protein